MHVGILKSAKFLWRFSDVQLERRCAIDLLSDLMGVKDAVIYVDPPYRTSDTTPYSFDGGSVEDMTLVIKSQQGEVAISGYGDEWRHLGWQRHEIESQLTHFGEHAHRGAEPRTEVLWTNYDAHAEQSIGGLFA